ncbi:MAG: protein phosphatase 2C domain-containing protein [Clostridia bacterium]|nr:protein phosphatase 2C domain-containing protein [Clostridia bacterium]
MGKLDKLKIALLSVASKLGMGAAKAPDEPTEEKEAAREPAPAEKSIRRHAFAVSSIGHSHKKEGTLCQDWAETAEGDGFLIIAVSDGHGSRNFVRSDRGSRFACRAALDAMHDFASEIRAEHIVGSRRANEVVSMLCKNIIMRWRDAVNEDVKACPFTEDEVKNVSDKYRESYLAGEQAEHAYGATLIALLITEEYMLAIRNGDGECVTVSRRGHMDKPIPWNDKCEASVVTSMCDRSAIDEFRFFYTTDLPAAAFIGTDGVDNSYPRTEELFELYANICTEAVDNGAENMKGELEAFLPVMTEKGSGDDVSIAAILDSELLNGVRDELMEQRMRVERTHELRRLNRRLVRLGDQESDEASALKDEISQLEAAIRADREKARELAAAAEAEKAAAVKAEWDSEIWDDVKKR